MMTWVYSLQRGGLRQFVLQQLGGAADAAERILDFVRQVADQLAVGLLLLDQALLAGGGQVVLDGLQFEQQAHSGRDFRAQRGHRAVDVQNLAVAAQGSTFWPV